MRLTEELNEMSTEQKIKEVLSLLNESIHQGYISARLQEISRMPKYFSWIYFENNTIFHHIVLLYLENADSRARQFLVDVAEMILESISQETRMALLQNKNSDKKTPFDLALDRDLGDLMDKFLIYNVLDMEESDDKMDEEIEEYLRQLNQIAIEHDYLKSGIVDSNNNMLSCNNVINVPDVKVRFNEPRSEVCGLKDVTKIADECLTAST